jgi:hypothetical protein
VVKTPHFYRVGGGGVGLGNAGEDGRLFATAKIILKKRSVEKYVHFSDRASKRLKAEVYPKVSKSVPTAQRTLSNHFKYETFNVSQGCRSYCDNRTIKNYIQSAKL